MTDNTGKKLKAGQTLMRVVEGRVTPIGYEYKLESRRWNDTDTHESLVANGGFICELVTDERAKEYRIIE